MGATGIIDRQKLEDAFKGFSTLFHQAMSHTEVITELLATIVNARGPEQVYNWMGPAPKMREWVGDRRFEELRAYDWTIRNKDWANGIVVKANDLSDEASAGLDLARIRITQMAEEAKRHEEELLIDLLVAGFTTACYDGQYFFDTDHVDGSGPTQSNKGTSALDATSLDAAILAMNSIRDENGEPMNIQPTHLVYGPKLASTVRNLLEAEIISSSTNTQAGLVTPVMSKRLVYGGAYDDYWFLLALGGPVKPLILQRCEPVKFVAQDEPTSEPYMNRKEFRYGADWRGNVGYGLWQFAYGAIV